MIGFFIFSTCFVCCQKEDIPRIEEDIDLPGHSECFAQPLERDVCQAVVDADPRQPTTSENHSGMDSVENDPRLIDPDYIWLTEQINQCTCVCCHTESLSGPGVYFWNIEYEPVWIDSASNWSLLVLSGQTNEEKQTLPSDDPERIFAIIKKELERRENDD